MRGIANDKLLLRRRRLCVESMALSLFPCSLILGTPRFLLDTAFRGMLHQSSSVLDRPICGRRERRKVAGELLHHHVYKRVSSSSGSSSSTAAADEILLPDFVYLNLSSSSRDEKKILLPRRQKTGGRAGAFKPGGSLRRA